MGIYYTDINLLILGNVEIVKVFRYLGHFHMNIDCKDYYDNNSELNYDLIITNQEHLDSIVNFEGLIFNVTEENDYSTKKNLANIVLNFKSNQILDKQFIENPKWNFYYKSIDKTKVKFIYDLFTTCEAYNKIQSREIKFHKIE